MEKMIKSLVHPDPTCVRFKSCEGKSIEINKYFLFLYDAFYRSILDDRMEESLVFIFDGASFDELIVLRENILQKHLQCIDHAQISNQKMDIEDCKINSVSDPSQVLSNETNYNPEKRNFDEDHENRNVDDDLILECPFNCKDVPESKWTPDLLFAHIFSKHDDDVKNNFYVSIDTFIDRLALKLSGKQCAFNCKTGYVYSDLTSLKFHYYRCHAEDPVICTNCGDSFKNPMIYKSHTRDCHVLKKDCDLCGDGKTYKYIRMHMKHCHGEREKKFKCHVDGCSLKFFSQVDLTKHTRVVHKKEKPFVCDKCGIKMAQFFNLKDHRIKVHREGNITFKEFKEMIRAGQHQFLSKESEIPSYM